MNQLTPKRPKNRLFTQIDLLHRWPKQAVTMTEQAKFLLQPSNTPFSCYHCQFLPTFTILPAYIQYDSVLAYQRGPVRPHEVSYNNRFSTNIIAPAIWSYSGSGVQLLSAVIYCCSISIIQCWLALLACCGPRGFFRANKALLQNTLTLTFS